MSAEILKSAWKVIPMFQSRSIPLTIQFYTEKLGFELASGKPEEGSSEQTFCSLFIGRKADANFYFSKATTGNFTPSQAMIALGTSQLDEYYDHLRSLDDVEIVEDIEDTPGAIRGKTEGTFEWLSHFTPLMAMDSAHNKTRSTLLRCLDLAALTDFKEYKEGGHYAHDVESIFCSLTMKKNSSLTSFIH
ncbi:unnamed protein product [Penicillium palitans]